MATTTTLVALGAVLVAGWLLGLASHPGGRKWRQRYAAEREAHAANRQAAERAVADANARVAALERDNARLSVATPAPAPASARTRPVAARGPVSRAGWFDWSRTPAA